MKIEYWNTLLQASKFARLPTLTWRWDQDAKGGNTGEQLNNQIFSSLALMIQTPYEGEKSTVEPTVKRLVSHENPTSVDPNLLGSLTQHIEESRP